MDLAVDLGDVGVRRVGLLTVTHLGGRSCGGAAGPELVATHFPMAVQNSHRTSSTFPMRRVFDAEPDERAAIACVVLGVGPGGAALRRRWRTGGAMVAPSVRGASTTGLRPLRMVCS